MQLTEQYIIKPTNPYFEMIDQASFAAKNLYNKANYIVRQSFIFENKYISYRALNGLLKDSDEYRGLPAKVSQWVLKSLDSSWQSFFAAIKAWKSDPSRFTGMPSLPNYKDKENGRYLLIYTIQAISIKGLRNGRIELSRLPISIKTTVDPEVINQVRIVPKRNGHYSIEVVYTKESEQVDLDYNLIAGVDLGIDNLMAITSNKKGFIPLLVNGRPLKSINQFYNKIKASLQSKLPEKRYSSHRLSNLTEKRNRQIKHYLHTASRRIINHLIDNKIGILVIGKNNGWKQKVKIGRRNNQNFVSIPHSQLINMLTYKAELAGIEVVLTEESYTSKTSFLDNELPKKHEDYAGRRVKRGLFKSGNGKLINADINASYQIIKKEFPNAFGNGIEDVVVHPLRLNIL